MLDRFKRALISTFSIIGSALGAMLGLILYPLANLLRLAKIFCSSLFNVTLIIPALSISTGFFLNTYLGVGILGSFAGSLVMAGALMGLSLGVLPIVFTLAILRALVQSPIVGFRVGWSEGLASLLSNTFNMVFGRAAYILPQPGINTVFSQDLFGVTGVDYNTLLQQLGEHVVDVGRRPMTAAEFSACELSTIEMRAIVSNRCAQLSDAEIELLEPTSAESREMAALLVKSRQGLRLTAYEINQLESHEALKAYKNLQRLETDPCPILQYRPDRENAVLLVKQYKIGTQWFPVPGVANIFDKTALKTCFVGTETLRGDAIHPLNKDVISAPTPYKIDGFEHETRYVYHNYYVTGERDEEPGVSQEINKLSFVLRERLQQLQLVGAHHDEPRIALTS